MVPLAPRTDAPIDDGLLACLSETRIGLFDFSATTRTEALGHVSGSSHRASVVSSREVTTDLDLYTQPDPVGLGSGVHLFAYANLNPPSNVDPHGDRWESRCCNDFDKAHLQERLNQVADLQRGYMYGTMPPALPWSPWGSTVCNNRRPITDYNNMGRGSCIDLCVRAHEQFHRKECRTGFYDKMVEDRSIPLWLPEALAYVREFQCLKEALQQGFVSADVDPIGRRNR